ncbi:MAG: hypothetical protein EA397_17290 [Deltaproteobacteria bacterium]|nr:MAG: hypothetical protein EA397_17290 [Deltaproteobacteria bacterium]
MDRRQLPFGLAAIFGGMALASATHGRRPSPSRVDAQRPAGPAHPVDERLTTVCHATLQRR